MTAPGGRPASLALPPPPAAVHFIGIGGIGMSGLARILRAWDYRVTGSDAAESPQTAALSREGIPVVIGHGATAAANADLLVISAAIHEDDPELLAARAAGVRVIKRAELLGMLANARRSVAVAGSHGKSTTSGMLTSALLALDAAPSYAVGAVIGTTGTNAAPGDGDIMVVEADEYDYSFLWLHPDVAIVTNVDYDHPDIFPDQTAYDEAFSRFISGIKPDGVLIIATDDPGCQRVLQLRRDDLSRPARVVTFGESHDADWQLTGDGTGWTVNTPDGGRLPLRLTVPGRHNARNAVAAAAAMAALGWSTDAAIESLASYRGVGRRFDFKGCAGDVIVIDDYAHHPTEIRATIAAAREQYPDRRLWAVFQPHTYSRTKALMTEFAMALAAADDVIVLDIYPSRETDSLGISSADLVNRLPKPGHAGGQPAEVADYLTNHVQAGDVVLTIGAGDVTQIGPQLLAALSRRDL
ncbi:MAG TPA: UDP-N-acetylmuramate--L-alanine ligase [Thermomicrobiales bacterium]|nr:UDP-N-acetylmuramate--L-alanine ligase [Thermomicrobiales bacterium]